VDVAYPEEHADLQRAIAEVGAVVSEAPLGTQPQARHFPRRNRIIAGLAQGVVVIEAALRSGSLITARIALEADREVMAVPGSPLDPRSRGSNDLLRQGARLVETAADILEQLEERPPRALFPIGTSLGLAQDVEAFVTEDAPGESAEQVREVVAELLGPSPTSVDDLVRGCQFSAPAVLAALLDLEVAGRAIALPGNRFALVTGAAP
jgi:DNA processing protein